MRTYDTRAACGSRRSESNHRLKGSPDRRKGSNTGIAKTASRLVDGPVGQRLIEAPRAYNTARTLWRTAGGLDLSIARQSRG